MTPFGHILLLTALLLGQHALLAQTASAEEYFNRAAKQYVKEDKLNALRTLDKGLQEHPGDARLLKLAEELLKEEQQKLQQASKEEKKDGGEEEKKDEGEDKKKDGGEDEKKDGGKDGKKDGGEDEKKDGGKDEKKDGGEEERGEKRKPQPGKISPQEAERMLDALNRKEKEVQEKVRDRKRPVPRTPIEKDW